MSRHEYKTLSALARRIESLIDAAIGGEVSVVGQHCCLFFTSPPFVFREIVAGKVLPYVAVGFVYLLTFVASRKLLMNNT